MEMGVPLCGYWDAETVPPQLTGWNIPLPGTSQNDTDVQQTTRELLLLFRERFQLEPNELSVSFQQLAIAEKRAAESAPELFQQLIDIRSRGSEPFEGHTVGWLKLGSYSHCDRVMKILTKAVEMTKAGSEIIKLKKKIADLVRGQSDLAEQMKTAPAAKMQKKLTTAAEIDAWKAKMSRVIGKKGEQAIKARAELVVAEKATQETEAFREVQEACAILEKLEEEYKLRTAYERSDGLLKKTVGGNEAVRAGRRFEERLFVHEKNDGQKKDPATHPEEAPLTDSPPLPPTDDAEYYAEWGQIRAVVGVLASTTSAATGCNSEGRDVDELHRRQQLVLHSVGAAADLVGGERVGGVHVDGESKGAEGGAEWHWYWFLQCHEQTKRDPKRRWTAADPWTAACREHGMPDFRLLKNLKLWKNEQVL
jgi:hypothetical protein